MRGEDASFEASKVPKNAATASQRAAGVSRAYHPARRDIESNSCRSEFLSGLVPQRQELNQLISGRIPKRTLPPGGNQVPPAGRRPTEADSEAQVAGPKFVAPPARLGCDTSWWQRIL